MKKSTVIEAVKKARACSTREATDIVNLVLHQMYSELLGCGELKLKNFGTFRVIPRKPRENSFNPKTREPVGPKESLRVKFVPSRKMEDDLHTFMTIVKHGEAL